MKFINAVFRLRYLYLAIALVLISMGVSSLINEFSNWQYVTTWVSIICFGYMILLVIIGLIVGGISGIKERKEDKKQQAEEAEKERE